MNTKPLVASLVAALAFGALPLAAQQSGLTGAVTDTTGAVIVGAEVALVNSDTGVSASAQTNESGAFNFTLVQPGMYELL